MGIEPNRKDTAAPKIRSWDLMAAARAAIGSHSEVVFGISIGIAVLAAVVLRWQGLGAQSLWMDEGYTLWISKFSPHRIWEILSGDTSTPLYYVLLHYWIRWFGDSEVSLRSLSALFGTLSIPMIYLLSRKILVDRVSVLLAMALYAVSFYQIWYAKEARCYALLVFLSIGSVYCLVRCLEKPSLTRFLGLVLFLTASLYTHNMAFFYLPGLAVVWLIYPGQRTLARRIGDSVFVFAAVFLLYLPWLRTLRQQLKSVHTAFWVTAPRGRDLLDSLGVLLGIDPRTGQEIFRGRLHLDVFGLFGYWTWVGLVFFVFVFFVLGGFYRVNAENRRKYTALLAYSLSPLFLVFIYSRVATPIYINRVFAGSAALLPMVICGTIAFQAGKRRRIFELIGFLILLATALSAVGYLGRARKDDWRGLTTYLVNTSTIGRLTVVIPDSCQSLVRYYASRVSSSNPPIEVTGLLTRFDPPEFQSIQDDKNPDVLSTIKKAARSGKYRGIDFITGTGASPDLLEPIPQFLQANCASVEVVGFYELELRRCQLQSTSSPEEDDGKQGSPGRMDRH